MFGRRASHCLTIVGVLLLGALSSAPAFGPVASWDLARELETHLNITLTWGQFFDGKPTDPINANWFGWSRLLKFDHARCDVWASPMDYLVRDYDIAAYHGEAGKADDLYGKISDILFTKLGESHPCFKAAALSYALNSIYWIDNIVFEFEERGSRDLKDSLDFSEISPSKAYLVAALMNFGKIEALTPSIRAKRGGIWNKPTKRGNPEILGTFDCAASTISFDVLQRPLDEGATLIHELDHFMRDKVLSNEYAAFAAKYDPDSFTAASVSQARADLKKMKWQDILLLDETLSTSYSALIQLRFRMSPAFTSLNNDLSFSKGHGPISKIWNTDKYLHGVSEHNIDRLGIFLALGNFGTEAVLLYPLRSESDDRSGFKRSLKRKLSESIREIYRLVLDAYFSEGGRSRLFDELSSEANHLNPVHVSEDWVVLASWDGMLPWETFVDPSARRESYPGDEYADLAELTSVTAGPSSVCRSYRSALSAGKIEGYLGAEGFREEKGVKGTVPIQTEKGVKGEDATLRLCADLGHKI